MSLGITAVARPWPGTGRLLRIELRRSAMLWLLPLAAALYYYQAYRRALALPPVWGFRAMTLQNDALLDFAMPVAGGAAWVGARESRRHLADLLAGTARSRWARQLAAWTAVTCWALAGYLACTGVVYAITARQATWGGPLWWPVAVDAAGVALVSAAAFAAGALLPSRFTAPLAAVAAFFALGLSIEAVHDGSTAWLIAPGVAGSALGPNLGVATFYGFLPDLSIVQVMFLVGLTAAVLGGMGLVPGAAGRRARAAAAALALAGLAAAGTAAGLAGTARFDRHGMTVIPALHDAASGAPVPYTPVCAAGPVPVCLHPAYAGYLPAVAAALRGVLSEVAGLPGAPSRVAPAAPTYSLSASGEISSSSGVSGRGTALLILPEPPPGVAVNGLTVTAAEFAAQAEADVAPDIVGRVIGQGSPAQAAVTAALLRDGAAGLATPEFSLGGQGPRAPGRAPGRVTPASRRFAALPPAARHAWLASHLAALRAGRVPLAQLP
jgi:hypothetical protein